ncbi:MAG: hypothetical protein IKO36_05240 [Bacteroidaceae bacterium]|nr:hypothetical protein [Bacteroidaceae bacterium]
MKKETRRLLELIASIETETKLNRICAEVDRAYQQEKISYKDNELLYKLINKINRLMFW